MTNTPNPPEDKKIVKAPASPFNNDPHNNRGGKKGKKSAFSGGNSGQKMKSVNVPKFKGGSGGDR